MKYGRKVFKVMVLEFIRGERATSEIKQANIFNPEPKEGHEYLLVKVRLVYVSGNEPQLISSHAFKAYVKGAGFSFALLVLPDDKPSLKSVNLLPGGEVEGWIAYEVPKNERVLIAFEPLFEPLCFIKIE